jgi:YebC/PmpR family DNA-binding regulatory protein
MAGHSKWANIQHRKGAQDRKRAKAFTRLIRELTVAARSGGEDADANPRLRLALDRARAQNMPRDTIERAVKRGAGRLEGSEIQEVAYEGYGPGGVAILVECMTDNRNRTVSEVRGAFTHHGGSLGAGGSVSYLFNPVGLLAYPPGTGEERLLEAALDAGAEDVVVADDGSAEVLTAPGDFVAVRDALTAAGLAPAGAEVTLRAATAAPVGAEDAARVARLLEALEELDDVQQVYSNAEFPDEVLARLA